MSDGIQATCVTHTLCKIDTNICEQDKDFIIQVPLIFPEGTDFELLDFEKLNIDSVDIDIKPYDNFTVKNAGKEGWINGDFPVYLNVYTGNTIGDSAPTSFSSFVLRGEYRVGTATSGIHATLTGRWFKTVFGKVPETTADVKMNIVNKENGTQTIDDSVAEGPNTILQKGIISIGIKMSDFICKAANVLKSGNIKNEYTKEQGEDKDTAAIRILEHIKSKEKRFNELYNLSPKEEVAKKVKKSKKNTPPSDDDLPVEGGVLKDGEEWVEDPIVEDGKNVLRLNYIFWVRATYNVTYWRRRN